MFGSAVVVLSLMVWVLASMPENLQANGGYGSTHIYDYLVSLPVLARIAGIAEHEEHGPRVLRTYFHKDTINGLWIFFTGSVFEVGYSLFLVIAHPGAAFSWLTFVTSATFFGGAALMLHTSFPENKNSTTVHDFMVIKASEAAVAVWGDQSSRHAAETQPLLSRTSDDTECPLLHNGDDDDVDDDAGDGGGGGSGSE